MIEEHMKILESQNSQDKELWRYLVEHYFQGEPMLLPQYLDLFVKVGEKALCAVKKQGKDVILFPFIKRQIPGMKYYYDSTSAYGYGGMLATKTVKDIEKEKFWKEFEVYAQKENIICEFVRFMLEKEKKSLYPGKIVKRTSNIIRTLDLPLETIWMDCEHKVRKNVKKAKKYGLKIGIDHGERLDEFLEIYYETMQRRNADSEYYFGKEFFCNINETLKSHVIFFHVLHWEKIVSTELVLYGNETMYSYLGGTKKETFKMRPNDYLKYQMIKWGKQHGMKKLVLGGGYGEDDGIYKYKKSFAPSGIVSFYTGEKIYNEEIYHLLEKERGKQDQKQNQYFPIYRLDDK